MVEICFPESENQRASEPRNHLIPKMRHSLTHKSPRWHNTPGPGMCNTSRTQSNCSYPECNFKLQGFESTVFRVDELCLQKQSCGWPPTTKHTFAHTQPHTNVHTYTTHDIDHAPPSLPLGIQDTTWRRCTTTFSCTGPTATRASEVPSPTEARITDADDGHRNLAYGVCADNAIKDDEAI
jgi:hypothetical protein